MQKAARPTYPRIHLADCPLCVAGRKRYHLNGRLIDEACAVCAGRGTLVTDSAADIDLVRLAA